MNMELHELRAAIDGIDRELIDALERRMDVAAQIAAYKREHEMPVLDAVREKEKLAAVAALCRPETAALIPGVFEAILAASRAYQATLMEAEHA